MLAIRFIRVGKKNQPFFRMVVTEKQNAPKGGRFLEILGFFNPKTKETELKKERIEYWLSVGAQPSDRVHNLLVTNGVIKADKKAVHSKKKVKEGEEGIEVKPAEKAKPAESEAKPVETPAKEEIKEGTDKPAEFETKPDVKPEPEKPAPAKEEAKPEEKQKEAKPEAKVKEDSKSEEKKEQAKPEEK